MAWVPAVIAAGASLIGGSRANRASRDLSGSAHQREVADLRLAGLNPILSGTGGPGSSTPQQDDVATPAVNTGLSLQRAILENRLLRRQEQLVSQQELKTRNEAVHEQQRVAINAAFGAPQAASALEAQSLTNELTRRAVPRAQLETELWTEGARGVAELLKRFGAGGTGERLMERLRTLGELGGVK